MVLPKYDTQNTYPYTRTKFWRTKFLADKIFRRTKFQATSQIFGTFIRRKFVRYGILLAIIENGNSGARSTHFQYMIEFTTIAIYTIVTLSLDMKKYQHICSFLSNFRYIFFHSVPLNETSLGSLVQYSSPQVHNETRTNLPWKTRHEIEGEYFRPFKICVQAHPTDRLTDRLFQELFHMYNSFYEMQLTTKRKQFY